MQLDERLKNSIADMKEKVLELAKRRGFFWPSYEIYGGVAGMWDYGPLGAMLKLRVENAWRQIFVVGEGFLPIDTPTIGTEDVFLASGHLSNFVDLIVECVDCNTALRADHVVTEYLSKAGIDVDICDAALSDTCVPSREKVQALIEEYSIPCPDCGGPLSEVRDFNLMFATHIGPGTQRKGYLRPETAQGIFTDFPRLARFYRDKLPFGVVQVGRSYRNEISPRQGIIRLREFTQAEAEIFVDPRDKNAHPRFQEIKETELNVRSLRSTGRTTVGAACDGGIIAHEYLAYHIARSYAFFKRVGVQESRLRFRQHLPDEMAHYAIDCWDAEGLTDYGWIELAGIADRTDFDLKQHEQQSGTQMAVFIPYEQPQETVRTIIHPNMSFLGPKYKGKAKTVAEYLSQLNEIPEHIVFEGETVDPEGYSVETVSETVTGEFVTPHVIEPSFGIDRTIYTILEHAYDEDTVSGERRVVLRLAPEVAPIEVAVFPLIKSLNEQASEVFHLLRRHGFLVEYDDSGTIGRRYRRHDEIGTPFAVTIDHQTLEDGTVTVRDRDTTNQVRKPIEGLSAVLRAMLQRGFAD
ncbi:MAG: glycine--tRNA ligase [Halobacteriota archaeon]